MKQKLYSDSYMQKHWRQAVLKEFNNCCFFCKKPSYQVEIECHHIVKRKMWILKNDYRNGIPVCKYGCHQNAETPFGKHQISEYLISKNYLNYLQERSGNAKDYLFKIGMSKPEYQAKMLMELKQIIGG
jgi:hypothetical protein